MDNPEKLATYKCRVHKMKTNKTKTQHNMCWTPLYANKQTYVYELYSQYNFNIF